MVSLVLISSTACSKIPVHEPVGCVGLPKMDNFTETELAPLDDQTFYKVLDMAARYRARIESQCKINEVHDELHAD